MTTHDLALDNLTVLRATHGNTSPDGGKIDYDSMYNQTNGFQDLSKHLNNVFKSNMN